MAMIELNRDEYFGEAVFQHIEYDVTMNPASSRYDDSGLIKVYEPRISMMVLIWTW